MEWMVLPLKRYFQFSGRSRRKEYWMYILFLIIATILLSILDSILGLGGSSTAGPGATDGTGYSYGASTSGGWLTNIFTLATLIPSIAVGVRRLHDTDRSGWWILAPLGPYLVGAVLLFGGMMGQINALVIFGGIIMLLGAIAAIVLLVWYCQVGTNGPNRFGEDPLGGSMDNLAETFQ